MMNLSDEVIKGAIQNMAKNHVFWQLFNGWLAKKEWHLKFYVNNKIINRKREKELKKTVVICKRIFDHQCKAEKINVKTKENTPVLLPVNVMNKEIITEAQHLNRGTVVQMNATHYVYGRWSLTLCVTQQILLTGLPTW